MTIQEATKQFADQMRTGMKNLCAITVFLSEEDIDRFLEIEPDPYTGSLTAWLASNAHNVYYLTKVLEEIGATDGFQLLAQAQYLQRKEVAEAVLQGICKHINELQA